MIRLRAEVGKGISADRQKTITFHADNNGVAANVLYGIVCTPRTRYDIAKVEVYSAVKVAGGTNTLDLHIGRAGETERIVAADDPNAMVTAGYATIANQPDFARRVRMTLSDNAGGNLIVAITVTGLDANSNRLVEVITNAAAGSGNTDGTARFLSISSIVPVIVAGSGDALDTLAVSTLDEKVIAQFDPDTMTAGAAPLTPALLAPAYNIRGGTPVWAKLVTDHGSAAAPPDVSVTVHWEPNLGAYDGETVYGAYDA